MPEPYWASEDGDVVLHLGDCLDVLRTMEAGSIDAIVTDPPAGIAFMDREWDDFRRARNPADADRDNVFGRTSARGPEYGRRDRRAFVDMLTARLAEAYRVLKPGGHALVWSIPRTSHWTAWAIEDAGFDLRDCVLHLFGCLSEDTEILVNGQWEPYRNVKSGSLVLAYNLEHDEFAWEPVQEVYVYPDYRDTAFRIRGDHTDQIVSREHRCLIERGGTYVFERAEEAARQREARVPVLEDLSSLLAALPVPDEGTGRAQPDVLEGLRRPAVSGGEEGAAESPAESAADVPGVRRALPPAAIQTARGTGTGLLAAVPGNPGCRPTADPGGERAERLDGRLDGVVLGQDDRPGEPRMEGGCDLLPQERQLCAGQVRPLPAGIHGDGPQGRLRDGAPAPSGTGDRALPAPGGSGSPRRPRPAEQPAGEPDAVRDQPRSQAVRASRFTRSDLARIEPVEYSGLVWCVRVPSGAFVARRNGKVFVTGNSGFPKSRDVAKAIDRAAGAEREVLGVSPDSYDRSASSWQAEGGAPHGMVGRAEGPRLVTAPATEEAVRWEGWGTALKPGQEMWWLARKPLKGTVAANVLEYGTGALNIAASKAGGEQRVNNAGGSSSLQRVSRVESGYRPTVTTSQNEDSEVTGRWPANIVFTHSAACEQAGVRTIRNPSGSVTGDEPSALVDAVYSPRERVAYQARETETIPVFNCAPDCPVGELDRQSGVSTSTGGTASRSSGNGYRFKAEPKANQGGLGDTGGASRFYPTFRYQAKAPASERPRLEDGTAHETVKSLGLMTWMVKLITPPGGTVLDMFAGSGPVGEVCVIEGFRCVLIEKDPKSAELIKTRLRKPIQPVMFGLEAS